MAWYYGTFSCGCEGRVNVTGPTKNRQWIADRKFEGLCKECYAKKLELERIEANRIATEKARDMELPELTGTTKQVAWANTIRDEKLKELEEIINNVANKSIPELVTLRKIFKIEETKKDIVIEKLAMYLNDFQNILTSEDKASYYINNRFRSIYDLIRNNAEEIINEYSIEGEVIKECAIGPMDSKFDGIVEIISTNDKIGVKYEKNDTFRTIVKNLGYSWKNLCWERKITETTGSYIDRTAELGNKLLNAGFTISIQDEEIREKAINGNYEQECHRWIYGRKETNNFAIKWIGMNNELYTTSRKLPGSKWNSGATVVNVSRYKEVKEFAEMYGFKFAKSATEMMEQYITERNAIKKVNPNTIEPITDKNGLEDILNSSREVLEDLIEDD